MATTTATLTLSSSDLSSNSLSISSSSTLYKAGTTIGLDQTKHERRKYATAQTETTLISAGDYDDNTHARLFIKNVGTIGGGNAVMGRLYGGDYLFIPYEGEEDIDITSSTTNMELEYVIIYQAA